MKTVIEKGVVVNLFVKNRVSGNALLIAQWKEEKFLGEVEPGTPQQKKMRNL